MKNTSKLILGTLIVAIVFTLLSVSLAASSGDYKYDVKPDGTVILTKYTGNSADVTIPDTIDGKTVSAIGERAFRYASITSVTIPGCVNSIGLKAFLSCENLKTVVFQPSDDPLEIGDYAFDGDTSLVNVDIGAKQINLHERAFRYCSALQTISFSNDPTELSIGEKGFLNCTGLLSLDVPDSVQSLSIGAYAFDGDTALQDIQLSGETIKLNERAFRYCSAIHKVTFADNTTALEVGEKAFLGCSEMVFFDVPSQVTEFSAGGYAFDGASKLAVVGLGGGNAKLGERCFRYCESLTKLLIPNGNVTIGDKAFLGCNDLTLYVAPGSAAEQYAINNRLSFSDASQYEPVVVDDSNYVAPTAAEAPVATEQSSEPASQDWTCPNCGNEASGNFCNNCGAARPAENEPASTPAPTAQPTAAPVDSSDARHLQYIRNYVGLNALSIGYTSLGGDRLDKYGACTVKMAFITEDGTYIDIENDGQMQQYVVVGQNPAANTELRIGYQKKSNGEEYSNLTEWQSYESVDLYVRPVGSPQDMSVFPQYVEISPSPDKYTYYVLNYVGKNLASIGYTSLGGDRLEAYGAGHIEFGFITEDGAYIDIEDESQMQQYVVAAQSCAPNTEFKLVYQKNSSGEEYSNLIDSQTIEHIDLYLIKAGSPISEVPEMTIINPSEDKYTYFIRDYVGKNLANLGYTSLGGTRNDKYGAAYIQFVLVADDGSYIDPSNTDQLKQYVVTGQDVTPNSEMKLIYSRNSKGEEYSNLVDSQTYNKITLYVHKIEGASDTMPTPADDEEESITPEPTLAPPLVTAAPWGDEERQLSNGSYTVGVDIPAGTYHFWKIPGDGYTGTMYVYNPDNLNDEVASGSADETGCVLNLKDQQILKIGWTNVNVAPFNPDWEESGEIILPSGSYIVGEDIPEGSYHFWKIDGDRYTAVLYVFDPDNLKDEVSSGSADEMGCVLNLKAGQILKLAWTGAYTSRFESGWAEDEEKVLPSGSYTVGEDIPAGTYQFWKVEGDGYTAVMYVYNPDDLEHEIASGSGNEKGCVFNLKDGQIFKITWTSVNAARFNPEWIEGETLVLPSGSYVVGEDIPAGDYTFRKIEGDGYTAVLYVYNANDLENEIESGSARQDGYAATLSQGQILKITWTSVNASVENMVPLIGGNNSTAVSTEDSPKPVEATATPAPTSTPIPTPTATPTVAPTAASKDDLTYDLRSNEFKAVLNYILNPVNGAEVSSLVPMYDEYCNILMSDGSAYLVQASYYDGIMAIMCMPQGSSQKVLSDEIPYSYNDAGFMDALNFLLAPGGESATAVVPMYDQVYSVLTSEGNSYMMTVMYDDSMIAFELMGM